MDFKLSPESKMMVKAAREFCEKEIEPIRESVVEKDDYPDDLIVKFAKARLLGLTTPKEYGGVGTNNLNKILIAEEFGKTGTMLATPMFLNTANAEVMYHKGSEYVRNTFIRPLCEGKAIASTGFTEPATGSDPTALATTAVLDGDHFLINGTKRYITGGNKKGYGVFFVKDAGLEDKRANVTAIIVDKSSEGYSTSAPWKFMGLEGMNCVDVYFKDVRVPKENVLGERGNGFGILLSWAGGERIAQQAGMVGCGQAALEEAIKYSKERLVRGKPMAFLQGIQWMLADMKTRIDACRYMTYRAACLQDDGEPVGTISSELKIFVVPTIQEVTRLSLQVHGSYGYSKEYKIERLYRHAVHAGVVETSTELNKTIAGSNLIS